MSMDEIIIVVDEQDKVIKYKPRSNYLPNDRIRITATWVLNSKGDSLIAQRSHLKTNQPLLWGPAAAGTVVKGESYKDNALKEIEEEIGVKDIKLIPIDKFMWDNPGELRYCFSYKVVLDFPIEKFVIQQEEVEAVKWVSTKWLLEDVKLHPENYLNSSHKWAELFHLVD